MRLCISHIRPSQVTAAFSAPPNSVSLYIHKTSDCIQTLAGGASPPVDDLRWHSVLPALAVPRRHLTMLEQRHIMISVAEATGTGAVPEGRATTYHPALDHEAVRSQEQFQIHWPLHCISQSGKKRRPARVRSITIDHQCTTLEIGVK